MTNTINLEVLRTAIEASADERVRVAAGEAGSPDYDEGWAYVDGDDEIVIAWDSGVRTPAYAGAFEMI